LDPARPKRAVFDNALMTDAFSTSVFYRVPTTGKAPPLLTLDDIDPQDLQQCHVWGVDPGVSEIFVAVDGEAHQMRRFSAQEYNHLSGITRTNQHLRQWKENSADEQGVTITTLESELPTARTTRPEKMALHVQGVLRVLPRLLAYYGLRHQELRFLNYRGKQLAVNEMVNILAHGGKKYNPHNATRQIHDSQSDIK
ncbi:hypothetical protein BC940DRAFT_242052, partial [Gongronella butleri]